ncbi:hypothetical protein FA95DRAFT_1500529 [Auriscalpium vulgare]|uniref:Uncharacterized protein n=1 Tax=Auriscalpium vulgare TaxID=40419 RepID=A0ACB8RDC8_9AGAM|nr:hypothetical protein FA95DRAFT_1500529 [Auriscalpium vulgare]
MDQTRAATGGAPPAPPVPRRLLEGYTPAMGVYVVFTLNAVATLEGLNDPAAIAEASALPRTQYVGLVIEDIDLTLYDEKYEKCYVSLLSQGPPLPVASEGLDEDMCVPLAPATHRKGRGSISPTPRLPWNNLYHHTTIIESVRVPSLKRDYSRSPLLSVDDVGILTLAFNDDGLRSDEMEQVYKDSHPDSQTGSVRETYKIDESC